VFKLKKAAAVLMAALTIFADTSCSGKKTPVDVGELEVTFFDVGKADSIVLRSENSTVVIDCGEKGDGKEIVTYLEENDVSSVDYLIITHYDKDHVGGAAKVINKLDVKNVLAPNYEASSDEMDKYRKALTEKNITPQLLTSDMSFTLDNADYTVYAPKKDFYGEDNDNDFSLVTKVTHGSNVLLFTGDAMETRLDEIMDIGKCTLLKVPYHGRKLKNIGDFIDKVSPKCAVVCTSQAEFSSQVQNILLDKKIPMYSTCFNGRITAISSGKEIKIETEK
jgi:beta-lactamase superfamily II metal-dependent hydrolase